MLQLFSFVEIASPLMSVSRGARRGQTCPRADRSGSEGRDALGEIEELLDDAVANGTAVGVVAGVTDREGPVIRAASGRLSAGGPQPMEVDSVFWIASMTKAITSVAAMQVVERGIIRTDEPIAHLLPELADPQVLEGFDGSGRPILRPARGAITLGQLLSHSSGFAEHVWHDGIRRYIAAAGIPPTSTAKLAALAQPLVGDPGTVWQYGIGHDLAGRLVERVSGLTIDAYFREHIFGPIGMKDSGYEPDAPRRARAAGVHRRGADGSLAPFERVMPQGREYWPGGGSLSSTLDDYLAFARMILNEGRAGATRVLKPETARRLAEVQTGALPVSRLVPALPELSNEVEFLPGLRKAWGLGFMVNLDDIAGARRAGSLTWAGLGNTYFWIDPAAGIAGVVLTQILPFADRAVLDLVDRFERAVYADPRVGARR